MSYSQVLGARLARRLRKAVACAGVGAAVGAAVPATAIADGEYLGVGSCSSPVCHGAVSQRDGTRVLQNEYFTWSEHDAHAGAYDLLTNRQSQRIAANLGLGNAHEADVCLDCHATNVPAAARGERFQIDDGVSCEACHGAAKDWIETHDDRGVAHADNVARGLVALDEPVVRAQLCTSCHVAAPDRFVTHRIMAAGHPRTGFELDTFSFLQPPHYRIDDDYRERKTASDSATLWAVGQAMSAFRVFEALTDPARNHKGGWAEFTLFDCFSCHHEMNTRTPEASSRIGLPAVQKSSLLMYLAAMAVVDGARAERAEALLGQVDGALYEGGAKLQQAAVRLRDHVQADAGRLAAWNPTVASLEAVLARVASPKMAVHYRGYADAEQATMAAQALVATIEAKGGGSGPRFALLGKALEDLFDATESEAGFEMAAFSAALGSLRSALQ